MEQLGLAYIAGNARAQGIDADIVDGALDPERYERVLNTVRSSDFSVIGYPIYPETVQRVARDVRLLRQRQVTTHVTVGNHLATLHDIAVLRDFPEFDSTVRGEAEQTAVDLAVAVHANTSLDAIPGLTFRGPAGIHRNPSRENLSDLDTLPHPARDTLPLVIAAGNAPLVYSSRGCNARCDFCSVHNFFNAAPGGRWRGRSPNDVVDEIEALHHTFGVEEFAFADEQFLGHGRMGKARAIAIADEFLRRRLKIKWYIETRASGIEFDTFSILRRAGLSAVFMGLESGNDAALKSMHKGLTTAQSMRAITILQELEVMVSAGFIMFRPDTTLEELRRNLTFLSTAGCIELTALATRLRVYSGTVVERNLLSEGRLQGTYYDYEWSFRDSRVERCHDIISDSSDVLSVMYNEFAKFRRRGLITYVEMVALQRVMNSEPIRIVQELVDALDEGRPSDDLRDEVRRQFIRACDEFLRVLRFAAVCAERRGMAAGTQLLSPMYLC